MHKYFADWYRIAHLKPEGDLLGNRWKSIKNFGKSIDPLKAMDLVRLYIEKPLRNNDFLDEFRGFFKKTDPTFPMRGNELELRVLAGSTLVWCLNNCTKKLAYAVAFAELCAECKGLRPPPIIPEIIELAEKHLHERSAELRTSIVAKNIKAPGLKIDEQLQTLEEACQSGAVPSLGPPLKEILESLSDNIRNFGQNAAVCLNSLVGLLNFQQEETNILWWLFGGCSRDSNTKMSDLELATACLVAGKELSDLVIALPGPLSAKAFLDKILNSVGDGQKDSVNIKEAVNTADSLWKKHWLENKKIEDLKDLCPVHFAVEKSLEVDGAEEWLPLFEKSIGFAATKDMTPLNLSLQVYQESLLIRAIAEVK